MPKYIAPGPNVDPMTCPMCGTLADQWWRPLALVSHGYDEDPDEFVNVKGLLQVTCNACGESAYWFNDKMVHPAERIGPQPHTDMPEPVLELYREAQAVAAESPRAAAVLLRVAIERLLALSDRGGKGLNDAIGSYIAEGGVPEELQQALDTVRITGNDAAHHGELRLDDTAGGAAALFEIVNELVDRLVGFKARMSRIYASLDEDKRAQVTRRDAGVNAPDESPPTD